MKTKDKTRPLLMGLPLAELSNLLNQNGKRPYVADQIFDWVYKKDLLCPLKWANIAKDVREWVETNFRLDLPSVSWKGVSRDGTQKFLLEMKDAQTVEAVVIAAPHRLTLCLSTQVGCAMGCTFCHTATQGLTRHLEAGEIVGQFIAVQRELSAQDDSARLTHIVYMGMGEPLHNFEAVKKATGLFLEAKGLGLGQRRITLSTSGLVPQIEKLSDFPPINIAISLHGARDDIRSKLMPIGRRYDLQRLFKAVRTIPLKAHRHITYEYLLIKELNDGRKDIEALADLLPRKSSKVNLIPFNEYPGTPFRRPSRERIAWFQDELCRKGLTCTIRRTKGDDILAACGQLKTSVRRPHSQ
ncbi:MAG: 23S rRNA (adenine(2503)-C(2))-methyltransferase RlmN [Bacteriovoracales bacterium]|nr:23S rRNA (adenine(2503)-C(2))-methyltransferase RlmN [Bacteriovoracales bacterium]